MYQRNSESQNFITELYIMKKAANKAAVGIVRDFGELEKLQVSKKGVGNYVTASDIRSEKIITKELSKFNSSYSFLCEESGAYNPIHATREYMWVIDPIDGTNNFRKGIPYFCINIALTQKGMPIAGLTLDPIRGSTYKAARNVGAFAEGRNRLRVSNANSIQEAVIACHKVDVNLLLEKNAIIRQTGAVALDLAYLAAGKYDAVIANDVRWWDIAAGIVLIQEAGGCIKYSEYNGKYKVVAAASFKLVKLLMSIIQ